MHISIERLANDSLFGLTYSNGQLVNCLKMNPEEVLELYLDLKNELEETGVLTPDKNTEEDKRGYIYILKQTEGEVCKIGLTKDLDRRITQITPKLPFEVELCHSIETNAMYQAEKFLHEKFEDRRLNGEWFELEEKDINFFKNYY